MSWNLVLEAIRGHSVGNAAVSYFCYEQWPLLLSLLGALKLA